MLSRSYSLIPRQATMDECHALCMAPNAWTVWTCGLGEKAYLDRAARANRKATYHNYTDR